MAGNRRRFQRLSVDLAAYVLGPEGLHIPVTILNLSRGGALLAGDCALKSSLYRRKGGYTHRPVGAELELDLADAAGPQRVAGIGAYLRRIDEHSFQVGFHFQQVQAPAWLAALVPVSTTAIAADVA
ncbi:MAG: PilZ domain-containing protein [Halieaceae bacterium]